MEKSTRKLLSGSMIYFVGNALTQLVSLLLLRFVTGKITPEEYGTYNLVVTVSNLIAPFLTLQISDAVFKFLIQSKTEEDKKKYYTVAFYVSVASIALTFLGTYATHFWIAELPHPHLIAMYLAATNLYTVYQRIVRSLGHSKVYVAGNLLRTVVYISLEIFFIYVFEMGVEALFWSVICSYFVFLLFAEWQIKSLWLLDIRHFPKQNFGEMVRFSLPLIPNAVFWWLTTSINTVIVSARCGLDVNGIYTVANKFSAVLIMVTSVFSLAWQESAIAEYGDEKFKQFFTGTFNMIMKGTFSVVAVLLPFMALVFPYLLDESYHASIDYAPFLLLASGISAISGFTAQIFVAQSKNHKSLFTNVLGMVINITVIFCLVDKIGLWAAVCGSLAADLAISVSRLVLVRKEFAKGVEIGSFALVFALIAIGILCYFKGNPLWQLLCLLLSIGAALALNWQLIKNILLILFHKTEKANEGEHQ